MQLCLSNRICPALCILVLQSNYLCGIISETFQFFLIRDENGKKIARQENESDGPSGRTEEKIHHLHSYGSGVFNLQLLLF